MSSSKRQSARKKRKKLYWSASPRVPVDPSKLNVGNSCALWFYHDIFICMHGHYYYADLPFTCKDCGKECVWRAEDQKWWYEEMQGLLDATAVRCRTCRIKERERKVEARRVSEKGKKRKR
ncbi:MAG: zinc-ribbon domain-containing protein, partial [Azoarcus sp.]|nr:zinc-ribbon domain-containing protein [Azoarcus sp.]